MRKGGYYIRYHKRPSEDSYFAEEIECENIGEAIQNVLSKGNPPKIKNRFMWLVKIYKMVSSNKLKPAVELRFFK